MRLIDADALADALFEKRKNYPQRGADTIGAMPDAIVRCKDCKHWEKNHKWVSPFGGSHIAPRCGHLCKRTNDNWFCADGERND